MSIPKAAGIETEYGIVIWGAVAFSPYEVSQLVLDAYHTLNSGPAISAVFEYGADAEDEENEEDTGQDGETGAEDSAASSPAAETQSAVYSLGSLMLSNGARYYIDHTHPEYCTPESVDARLVTAADKAGERILERCVDAVNRGGLLPAGQRVAIYKNNSDGHGISYGCHENYLLSAALYEDLTRRRSHLIYRYLLPFLVSRVVMCGAGKVGNENRTAPAVYQLSQRADFFETLVGLQTTYQRPLFNTRDEPHADPAVFRRLHVIPGDANMSELSTYLKIGTTQLVLSMIEDGAFSDDLTLRAPLEAFWQVSRDVTLRQPLLLEAGHALTAVDLQDIYLNRAETYLNERGGTAAQWAAWEHWAEALDALQDAQQSGDFGVLARRYDWAIKQRVLERYLAGQGTTWDAADRWQPVIVCGAINGDLAGARALAAAAGLNWSAYDQQREVYFGLHRLDLDYHAITSTGDSAGLYYRLQRGGHVERLLDDAAIEDMTQQPPPDTRAWLRGHVVERFSQHIISVDWSYVQLRHPDSARASIYRLELSNPLAGTASDLQEAWSQVQTPEQLFALFAPR